MNATLEYDIHNSKQSKLNSKVWIAGRFSYYALLDIDSRLESPVQFMFLIAKQYLS